MSYQLKSFAKAAGGSTPVRFQSGNSRDFAVKAGHLRHRLARQKQAYLQGHSAHAPSPTSCLPCRRSRVRIPSAASRRPAFAGLFARRVPAVRLRHRTMTGQSCPLATRGRVGRCSLAGDSGRPAPWNFCVPAEDRESTPPDRCSCPTGTPPPCPWSQCCLRRRAGLSTCLLLGVGCGSGGNRRSRPVRPASWASCARREVREPVFWHRFQKPARAVRPPPTPHCRRQRRHPPPVGTWATDRASAVPPTGAGSRKRVGPGRLQRLSVGRPS